MPRARWSKGCDDSATPFLDRLRVPWRATAEAVAAGYTHDEDLTWVSEPVPVADHRHA